MPRNLPQKLIFATAALILGWLCIRYLLPICLPFLLGAVLALGAEPVLTVLSGKAKLSRKIASPIAVIFVFVLTGTILVLVLGAFMRQLTLLQTALPQIEQAARDGMTLLQNWLLNLARRLPGGFGAALARLAENNNTGSLLTQQAMEKIPRLVAGAVEYLSAGIFGLITGIIAACMISIRLPELKQRLQKILPPVWQTKHLPALQNIRSALGGWLLAQLKLAGITFILLLAGFLLLRIPNSFLFALLVTVLDAFPVLGVGTILIPWSGVCLLQNNTVTGFGLLGLYGIIWLLRSILEPKLVGKGIGLDPLVTLASIYAGWQLLGIVGMLLAPIFALAAVQAVKAIRR